MIKLNETDKKSETFSWETEASKRKRKRDYENCSWEEWDRRKKEDDSSVDSQQQE